MPWSSLPRRHSCRRWFRGLQTRVETSLDPAGKVPAPHSPAVCNTVVSVLGSTFALLPGIFHHTDNHVFQREAPLPRADHADTIGFEFPAVRWLAGRRVFVRDDVQTIAEERNPPPLRRALEQIHRALRLVDD